ncbi:spindle assembly abnormal protein 6 homolog isoform X2 [Anneissia japonica]|uniref:spindle assembly abnormal protein 6 homolog isoform X2 n=1 Tax=Anneissia japonica TaxID=1529436 RepID=UPI001425760D|nr:spindle assembly abnormal protein 6 homolog isoform X2 [Anneissia japonica]
MSANCYNRRGNMEEMKEQHQRLSTKHIETLKVMADLSKENKKLSILIIDNDELSQCSELHTLANEAKARIKRVQEDCNRRLDHNNKTLAEKHQHEIMRVVSEKLEAENSWLEEKKQLENRIRQLESANTKLTEKLDVIKKNDTRIEVLHQQMDKAIEEVMNLKKENAQLKEENIAYSNKFLGLETEVNQLRPLEKQATELSLDLQEAKQKVRELGLQLMDKENILSVPPEPYDHKDRAELVKLKKEVVRLTKDVESAQNEMLTHREKAVSYQQQLLDSTNTLLEEQDEKEKLLILLGHTQDELQELKKKTRFEASNADSKNEVSFKEFVVLKRELNLLKDENLRLKQGRKSSQSLPCLKGSTTTSKASIWSHSSKGDMGLTNSASKLRSIPHSLKKY